MQSTKNPQLDAINMFLPLALAGICDMYANPYEDNRQAVLSELTEHIVNQKDRHDDEIAKALRRGLPAPPEESFYESVHYPIFSEISINGYLQRARDPVICRRYVHEIEEWDDPQIRWLKALKWEVLPGTTRFRRSDDDPYESETEIEDYDIDMTNPEAPESFYYTEDIAPHGANDEPLHLIDYSRRACMKFIYNKLVASEIRYIGRKR